MPIDSFPISGFDDLPNDPDRLKHQIRILYELLGRSGYELEILKDEIRHLRRKNATLRQFIYPPN